ncbi:hypothetical protein OnM2_c1490o47 [Erysiphe neolycopersici]|uniref:Uncharacterized protein n=1 Tax=Erysiphe neolycopersici TaxID=212602 RepID=A0A420I4D6_9PEZI|nr:hypothetical protein OnM2_c1490o47 [Erysiphe neolycopersici]
MQIIFTLAVQWCIAVKTCGTVLFRGKLQNVKNNDFSVFYCK